MIRVFVVTMTGFCEKQQGTDEANAAAANISRLFTANL